MSKHARKSSSPQLRILTAAMATGTMVVASAALAGNQSEPAAPARTATVLAGLQVPTPNSVLTGSTGTLTTALTSFSGATSSGGGPLAALAGPVPTTPSAVGPTTSSGPALVGPTTTSGPSSSSASVPIALVGRAPAGVPALPGDSRDPSRVPTLSPTAQLLPLIGNLDLVIARLVGLPGQILANPLNIIGPGGWLIGDAITPGANGGFLIGDGSRAGAGGFGGGSGVNNPVATGGNGGDGGDGGFGGDGGDGGDAQNPIGKAFGGDGSDGGTGLNNTGGEGGAGGTASGTGGSADGDPGSDG